MNPSNMSPLGRAINNSILQSQLNDNKRAGSKGIILSYDYISKLASIRVNHPTTNSLVNYHKVQVEEHGRGIKFVSLKPGDEVWVTFVNSATPIVTTIFTDKIDKEDLIIHYGPQTSKCMSYL